MVATFLAVRFDTVAAAEDALSTVAGLDAEENVSVRDAAVVIRAGDDRIELEQTHQTAPGEGIVGGGTAGLVAGLLLGLPVGGALLGLAGGALLGLRDTGIPDGRMRELGEELQPGQALLCVLVDSGGIDRARDVLDDYGTLVEVELSPDSES